VTVGIPGSGIGGLFYLLSALLIPVRELARRVRGHPGTVPTRFVLRHAGLVAGIVAGLWLTGRLLALIVLDSPAVAATAEDPATAAGMSNVLKMSTFLIGFGTLAAVLAGVQVARLVMRLRTAIVRSPVPVRKHRLTPDRITAPRAA
jgi:hypothetical protein